MTGGFYVPSALAESGACADDLILYAQNLWAGERWGPTNRGQIMLAEWILRHRQEAARLPILSAMIVRLLTGEVLPADPLAAQIEALTDGVLRHDLWTMTLSEPAILSQVASGAGDDVGDLPPRPASSPDDLPNGRLGERSSGRLFTARRGADGRILLRSGFGLSLAMEDAVAMSAWRALGRALGAAGTVA